MKKTMRLWDIILMNVTAIIGLRWIPMAAAFGASSIILWVMAALLVFIPLGLVSSELATAWPEEGGVYVWVKNAYGEKPAFITSWFYWITNLFYYPGLLMFTVTCLTYAINKPALSQNKLFICIVVISLFWLITLFNFKGLRISKWLSNLSGIFGTLLPGLIVVILAVIATFIFKKPAATSYSFANWIPHFGIKSGVDMSSLAAIMFAMAGIELTPILAGETEDPQKTFPKSVFISAIFIVGTYILGTVALTLILSPGKISSLNGILDAIVVSSNQLNIGWWLPVFVAAILLLGNCGGISVWIIGPIKMLFESTKKGVLPPAFTKLNKNDMPQNAMIIQGIIVTVIILLTQLLDSVNRIYQVLVLMTAITYFIPYLFMLASYLKLRKSQPDVPRPFKIPGGNVLPKIVAIVGFAAILFGIAVSFIPGAGMSTKEIIINEVEIGGGPLLLGLIGYIIYLNYEKNKALKKSDSKLDM